MSGTRNGPARAATMRKGVDVFTSGQVARLVGCADKTVCDWCDNGLLPHHRLPVNGRTSDLRKPSGGDRRVYRGDLAAFARANGIRLAGFDEPRAVAALVPDCPPGVELVSPCRAGWLVARGELRALVVGTADGLAAAVALARDVRALDPTCRLGLLPGADGPAAVAGGLFDVLLDPDAPPAAWALAEPEA